jgi:hypothetical protein
MLTAWDRALTRIKNNPPDCLLLMGEAVGDGDNKDIYDEALRWCNLKGTGVVVVAAASEKDVEEQLNLNALSRVIVQPTTLRDVRTSIAEVLKSKMNRE